MLTSLLTLALALASPAAAAPTERQWYWPDLPPNSPWYRVTCYTSTRCPQSVSPAYLNNVNALSTQCTALPAGMYSCRLERFPVQGGVPDDNMCSLNLYWRHRDGSCQNKVMDLQPLTYPWSWTCGSVWGSDIEGYSVDCSQRQGGGQNRIANGVVKGENAEGESGIGGE